MTAALLDAPSAFWAPPAVRWLRPQTGLTSTHLLSGAGGDTIGLFEAGYLPLYAANHKPVCIASHKSNWAALGTEHHVADIANLAMGDLPGSDVLWASVICTEVSPAGRRPRHRGPLGIDGRGRPIGSPRFARCRFRVLMSHASAASWAFSRFREPCHLDRSALRVISQRVWVCRPSFAAG